jgi:hypothetical protein
MQILQREIVSREAPKRRPFNVAAARSTGLVAPTAGQVARVRGDRQLHPRELEARAKEQLERSRAEVRVAGCNGNGNDWIDQAKREAAACMPNYIPNNAANACPTKADGTPNDCKRTGLREVTIAGQNPAQLAAGAPWQIIISPQAPILPLFVTINGVQAPNVVVSSIFYGTVNMLVGGVVSGEEFSTLNEQGGYRLPSSFWLTPGMTATFSGTALAAIASAGLLVVGIFGLTNAPG